MVTCVIHIQGHSYSPKKGKKRKMQGLIKNESSVLYLNRFPKMNGQGIPLVGKMMKFHAEECGVAATSKPWETKTVVTQTQVPSLLPKLLHEEKAISRLLSLLSQNSPHSSKCSECSTLVVQLLVLLPRIRLCDTQSKWERKHSSDGAV